MKEGVRETTYRSPKKAAREEAIRLNEGLAARDLEYSSPYDPDKHIEYPRMIELKPSRFAYQAEFIRQLGELVFDGEGDEVRLPALQKLRDRSYKMYMDANYDRDEPILQLAYDWNDMDFSAEIKEVLDRPDNTERIASLGEIYEDIATDPGAEQMAFDRPVREELASRIDISHSFESEVAGKVLLRWGLHNVPAEFETPDQKRRFLISLIPFFEGMSELEIEHLSEYVHRGEISWSYYLDETDESGLGLRQSLDGAYEIYLTHRHKRPERTEGKPIGCPAGFTFESMAADGIKKAMKATHETNEPEEPTVIIKALTAFVNEAYDRGILGENH